MITIDAMNTDIPIVSEILSQPIPYRCGVFEMTEPVMPNSMINQFQSIYLAMRLEVLLYPK